MKNPKNLPIILSILILITLPAQIGYSVEEDKETEDHRYFLGLSIQALRFNFSHEVENDVEFSFGVTAFFNYLLINHIHFSLGVNYNQSLFHDMIHINNELVDISMDYITIPAAIGFQYTFDDWITPYINLGGGINFLLSAQADLSNDEQVVVQDFSSQVHWYYPHLSAAIGLKMTMEGVGEFIFEANYNYAMTKPIASEIFSVPIRISDFNFSIGFAFELTPEKELVQEVQIIERERGIIEPYLQINKSYYAPDGTPDNQYLGIMIGDIDEDEFESYTIKIFREDGVLFHSFYREEPEQIIRWDGKKGDQTYVRSYTKYIVKAEVVYDDITFELGEDEEIFFNTGPVIVPVNQYVSKIRIYNIQFRDENYTLTRNSRDILETTYEKLKEYGQQDIIVSVLLENLTDESIQEANQKAAAIEYFLSTLGMQFQDIDYAGYLQEDINREIIEEGYTQGNTVVDIFIFSELIENL